VELLQVVLFMGVEGREGGTDRKYVSPCCPCEASHFSVDPVSSSRLTKLINALNLTTLGGFKGQIRKTKLHCINSV